MSIEPGWYKDPADPSTQRYWDGEGWLGEPIPADAPAPLGPPASARVAPPAVTPPAPPAPPAAPPGTGGTGPVGPLPGVPPAGYPYSVPGAPHPSTAAGAPRPHGLVLAGVGSRLVARIVDIIAVLLLCVVANAWFAVEFWRQIEPYFTEALRRQMAGESTEGLPMPADTAGTLLVMMLVATTAVWFAYEVPGSANSGQTLGKRLLGIKVVRLESDERLGFGRAFRRWGRLGLPTLLWYCWGVGFLLQVIDCLFVLIDRPLNQALHDKAAATVVVRVPRPGRPDSGALADATHGGRHADPS